MPEERIMLGLALTSLVEDYGAWADKIYGSAPEHGPIGVVKYLTLKVKWAERYARDVKVQEDEAKADPAITEDAARHHSSQIRGMLGGQLADCLLYILDANRRAGFSTLELVEKAQAITVRNKAIKHPKPTTDVPSEHVRELGGEG